MKLYLHIYEKTNPNTFETGIFEFNNKDATLQDLIKEISTVIPGGNKLVSIAPGFKYSPYSNLLLSVEHFLKDGDDLFVETEKPVAAATMVEEISPVFFEAIHKYIFYENDSENVRVTFEIQGIGKHPKDKIQARFLDESFEIKILDFNGKNYSFAVPKLQNKIIPEQSKYWLKENKVIINLRKFKKEDSWPSLFKQKAIGEN